MITLSRACAAAAAAVAVAGTITGVVLAAAPAGATNPTCRASELRPHYEGQQGAAGHLYDVYQMYNAGPTCQMDGFVTPTNFAADGHPLRTMVLSHQGTAGVVLLGNGQHASFAIGYQNPSITGCTPEAAVNMIVVPPGSPSPLLMGRGEKACNGDLVVTATVFGG